VKEGPPADVLRLYVNGWLTRTRGIPVLLEALRRDPDLPVEIYCAGRPACDEAHELLRDRRTRYFGLLSHEESLALYPSCHFAFTYYDPSIPINRIAEPNKWGDCLAMRTPFLANAEIASVVQWIQAGACRALPYDDIDALSEFLRGDARREAVTLRENLRGIAPEYWDEGVRVVLEAAAG